jgi:hypothetical protein
MVIELFAAAGRTDSLLSKFISDHTYKLHFIQFLTTTNHHFPIQHSPNGSRNAATLYSPRGTKRISMYNGCFLLFKRFIGSLFWRDHKIVKSDY